MNHPNTKFYEYFTQEKLNPERWAKILNDNKKSKQTYLRQGNEVKFLIDGKETFQSMVDSIETANRPGHFIYLLGWINQDDFPLVPGNPNTTFKNLITVASNKGVQVRTILWDNVSVTNTKEIKYVNTLPNGAGILDNYTLNLGSHHQKVLIVNGNKGLISFCGGLDINKDRLYSIGNGSPLHDVHCKIIGPSAFDLLVTFI
jgi:phosphatidylserine/phosphatidylglycerophosphate/cardiolipin synthase-like enzyme